ncbi:MAG: hypothetical protein ACLFUQ_06380 [Candidatus Izemoplasmataceae bacterium]
MKSRRLIIGVLLFVAVAVSSATFAYWASGITGNDDSATGTVTIGEGDEVTTTVAVGDESNGGPLVPVGFEGGGDVSDVDLTFEVDWDGTGASGATGTLSVITDSIEVNGTDYSDLFTVSVTSGDGAITAGSPQNVVVNVEFTNEPADEAEYDDVTTEDLIVTLTFDVESDDEAQ